MAATAGLPLAAVNRRGGRWWSLPGSGWQPSR